MIVRPDIFYFSTFKNPDRIFSRNGKKIDFFIADRIKIVPNLKKTQNKLSTKLYSEKNRCKECSP